MAKTCHDCGALNADSARFCSLCFKELPEEGSSQCPGLSDEREGYLERYPSSFDEDSDSLGTGSDSTKAGNVKPVDIGEYGKPSGYPTKP